MLAGIVLLVFTDLSIVIPVALVIVGLLLVVLPGVLLGVTEVAG
ncbi:MAG: hypothetical protein U5K28_13275 [Halobacteriales archaeon]|nr:hypothetical protein [Halobacteriales archaeon]